MIGNTSHGKLGEEIYNLSKPSQKNLKKKSVAVKAVPAAFL
jgi:hypothetical protein